MSDAFEDERERIREQKRRELLEQHGEVADTNSAGDQQFDTPVKVQGGDHLDKLVSENRVVLADCYADWCGPCQMMEPAIQAVAAETDAVVAKIDVDALQPLAAQLGVQGVPTLVLYVDGSPVERLVGAQSKGALESLIRQHT